jgi:hypothetical protein
MYYWKLAVLATLLVFGAAHADDVDTEKQVEMKFVVAGDDHDTITFDSNAAGFEPSDLAVGESRTIPNDSGRTITMTRTETGLQIDVDGKTIELPDVGAHGEHMMFVDAADVDVEILHDADMTTPVDIAVGTHAIRAHGPEGVTIISKEPLDDSVRESIRSVLISAGVDEEVTFIDGSAERHHIKVIKNVQTL